MNSFKKSVFLILLLISFFLKKSYTQITNDTIVYIVTVYEESTFSYNFFVLNEIPNNKSKANSYTDFLCELNKYGNMFSNSSGIVKAYPNMTNYFYNTKRNKLFILFNMDTIIKHETYFIKELSDSSCDISIYKIKCKLFKSKLKHTGDKISILSVNMPIPYFCNKSLIYYDIIQMDKIFTISETDKKNFKIFLNE